MEEGVLDDSKIVNDLDRILEKLEKHKKGKLQFDLAVHAPVGFLGFWISPALSTFSPPGHHPATVSPARSQGTAAA